MTQHPVNQGSARLGAPGQPDPSTAREHAIQTIANYLSPHVQAAQKAAQPPDIVHWAHSNYYIPETSMPIILQPHQQVFARAFTHPRPFDTPITTYMYSTCKKS